MISEALVCCADGIYREGYVHAMGMMNMTREAIVATPVSLTR